MGGTLSTNYHTTPYIPQPDTCTNKMRDDETIYDTDCATWRDNDSDNDSDLPTQAYSSSVPSAWSPATSVCSFRTAPDAFPPTPMLGSPTSRRAQFCPYYYFDSRDTDAPVDFNEYVRGRHATHALHTIERDLGGGLCRTYYLCVYMHGYELKKTPTHVRVSFVVIETRDDHLHRACFCSHRAREFFWLSAEDTQLIARRGHIRVYVARGTHATYPVRGSIWRRFGFANDYCDGGDMRIMCPTPFTHATQTSPLFSIVRAAIDTDIDACPTVSLEHVYRHNLFC